MQIEAVMECELLGTKALFLLHVVRPHEHAFVPID
jgi:hypothetical protein